MGYGSVVNVGLGVGDFDGETVGDLVGTGGASNMKGKNDYMLETRTDTNDGLPRVGPGVGLGDGESVKPIQS